MGAKYLCCLPLRLGVLVISLLQFLSSAAVTGLLAYVLILDAQGKDNVEIPSRTRIIAIVLASICGLVALISLTGFIGAIRKKESYVGIFSNLLRFFLVLQIATVVAYFVLYFIDKDEFKKICIGGSTDQNVIDACNSSSKLSIWVLVVSAVVPILFQAYGVYVVAAYARKLRSEDTYVFGGPSYVRVGEESHPLTHQPAYPYTDSAHKAV
ncbi:hypothetical protein B0H19DRAFT_1091056 [Mycena capillaripes]|nr:hypothetical protein B0H19DRAFT_1091056 [Mycena capillaripes]